MSNTAIVTTFGPMLDQTLRAHKMSQSKAAGRAEFDHSYLSRLINGDRNPSRDAVERIAAAIGCTETETDALLTAAGYLPGDAIALAADRDLLMLAIALYRVERTEQGRDWSRSIRENFRSLTKVADMVAIALESVNQ